MSNFTNFQAEIRDWVDRQSITDTVVNRWISMAERRANREIRVREQLTVVSLTLTAGAATLPSDWMETEYLRYQVAAGSSVADIRYGRPIEQRSAEQFYSLRYDEDNPDHVNSVYSINGNRLMVNQPQGVADGTLLELSYYAKVPPLASNTSNWLYDNYTDAYLNMALAASGMYLVEDERVPLWQTIATDMINKMNDAWVKAKNSGSPLKPRFRSFG